MARLDSSSLLAALPNLSVGARVLCTSPPTCPLNGRSAVFVVDTEGRAKRRRVGGVRGVGGDLTVFKIKPSSVGIVSDNR